MIGYYNYTVILTYIGAVFGFTGITYTFNGNIRMALICLMVSGFCDMFDGKIASTMKRTEQEKKFGIQIDSLSDLVCFGVLPALIVWKTTNGEQVYLSISIAYLLCALVRLAWFNVDEEERQNKEDSGRAVYLGLPVTTTALILPIVAGVLNLLDLSTGKILPWVLLSIAVAFISPFKLRKPGFIGKITMVLFGVVGLVAVLMGV